ncbi:MAG: DNA-processing protein DprA [Pseudomonadota bacterium]
MVATPATRQTERLTDWLTLHHAPGVGAVTCQHLLAKFGSPATIRAATSAQLQSLGLGRKSIEALQSPDPEALEHALAWQQQPDNHIISYADAAYPALLQQLDDAPAVLYVHGNIEVLGQLQLAMVGSRNPTPAGKQTAKEFARSLSQAGLVITSGLATGIDAASHSGALAAGRPTIAVMGTGLDRVYPARNRDLAHHIAERGALVSEFPLGTEPRPGNFPQRNRIISGLSLGALVVEAATRSGSLISARYASEQGREVFAIPGSIHNPLARGCHALIRQGAKLVETAQDILDELGPLLGAWAAAVTTATPADDPVEPAALDAEYSQLLDFIGYEQTAIDTLVTRSGLTPAEVSSMLLQLEMRGYVTASPGGLYNRLKS